MAQFGEDGWRDQNFVKKIRENFNCPNADEVIDWRGI